jgi:hypothetical protein
MGGCFVQPFRYQSVTVAAVEVDTPGRKSVLCYAVWATFGTFFSATVKEAVADVETTKEEKPKTGAGAAQSKAAVLNSLTSQSGQRTYDRAINDFLEWYCSEPRLAFNRTVVLRCRIYLEQKQYASTTINLRLAAVRRVGYEAADSGLLSPQLAAGIRRVKGVHGSESLSGIGLRPSRASDCWRV